MQKVHRFSKRALTGDSEEILDLLKCSLCHSCACQHAWPLFGCLVHQCPRRFLSLPLRSSSSHCWFISMSLVLHSTEIWLGTRQTPVEWRTTEPMDCPYFCWKMQACSVCLTVHFRDVQLVYLWCSSHIQEVWNSTISADGNPLSWNFYSSIHFPPSPPLFSFIFILAYTIATRESESTKPKECRWAEWRTVLFLLVRMRIHEAAAFFQPRYGRKNIVCSPTWCITEVWCQRLPTEQENAACPNTALPA